MRGLLLLLLQFLVYFAFTDMNPVTALQTDVIESIVLAGRNKFQCTFHLVLSPTNRINLKKSKVFCSPRRPKSQHAKNVKLSGKLGMYLVFLTINPSKIKSAKVLVVEATNPATTPTFTSDPGPEFCQLGLTRICKVENNIDCPAGLHKFCPTEKDTEKKDESSQGCSCLPTFLVQLAVQAESSPFGCNGGCACVESGLLRCGGTTRAPHEITTRMPDKKTNGFLNEMTSRIVTRITTRTPVWKETGVASIHTSSSLGKDKKLLFLGPGDPYYSAGRCEVLTLPDLQPSNCSVPLHPLSLEYFGSYVGTMTQWGTMICGGSVIGKHSTPLKSCYIYKHGVWKSSTPMLTARTNPSSAWIDGFWWVTGGLDLVKPTHHYHKELASTEMYNPITQTWSISIDLPRIMAGHSMVAINSTHVFLRGNDGQMPSKTAYIYSKDRGFVRIQDMPRENSRNPCATLGQNVWTVGYGGWKLPTPVEYFNLTSQTWQTGPSLPADIHSGGDLLVLNGKLVYIEKGIYELDNGVWEKVGKTYTVRGYEKVALEWGYEDCLDTGTTTTAGP